MPRYFGPHLKWAFRDVAISFVIGVLVGIMLVVMAVS